MESLQSSLVQVCPDKTGNTVNLVSGDRKIAEAFCDVITKKVGDRISSTVFDVENGVKTFVVVLAKEVKFDKSLTQYMDFLTEEYKNKNIGWLFNVRQDASKSSRAVLDRYNGLVSPQLKPFVCSGNEIVDRDIYYTIADILKNGHHPYLVGGTGTGKTVFCEWFSKNTGLPYLLINCDVGRLRDLIGRYELANIGGATVTNFKEGLLTQFLQSPSLVFFDEVNSLEGEYLFMLHEMLNNRRIFIPEEDKVMPIHPDCRIVLASNPTGYGYYGTKPLNVALLSRVAVLKMPLFTQDELKNIVGKGEKKIIRYYFEVNKMIASQKLNCGFGIREILQFVSLRNIVGEEEALKAAFLNKAGMNLAETEYVSLEGLNSFMF